MNPLLKIAVFALAGGLLTKIIFRKNKMYNLSNEMKKFHNEDVRLSQVQQSEMRERKNTNRERLKNGLAKNENPEIVQFIKQGSYAMKTMVQAPDNKYDIDDGVVFNEDDLMGSQGGAMSALDARKMVHKALKDGRFATEPEILKNCVRVHYNEGYHVDVPVYRKVKAEDENGNDVTILEHAGANWQESAPKAVNKWFKEANADKSPEEYQGQFRQVVRLLKMYTKRTATSEDKSPSGFIISVLAEECYEPDAERLDKALYNTMVNIQDRLEEDLEVAHPVLDKMLTKGTDDSSTKYIRDELKRHIDDHLSILFEDDVTFEDYAKAWRQTFKHDFFDNIEESKPVNLVNINRGVLDDEFYDDDGELKKLPRKVGKEKANRFA